MEEWTQLIPPTIAAVAMIVVGYLAGKFNVSAKKIEGATPSYQALDERATKMEKQIDLLRDQMEELGKHLLDARNFARDQSDFIEAHVPPEITRPFSNPPWI